MRLVAVSQNLGKAVDRLSFSPPVTHYYNPLDYAWAPHEAYLRRFGQGRKEALFLGMNPGPFGMAQTGVPFGDVGMVQRFLGIGAAAEHPVAQPAHPHPKRPVTGFACTRSEVSGSRFWGWAQSRYGSAESFFSRFFVVNYCPLVFMDEGGRNVTPDKLPATERAPLFALCDEALRKMVKELSPQVVIGVGAFAEKRAIEALADTGVKVATILHPSPASPAANHDWQGRIEQQLAALQIQL
jgi:single-strand selective monofunctional uracil DNA glycosylase